MFFVVAEIHNTGYLIGEFSTLEECNVVQSKIINLSIGYSYQDFQKIKTKLIGYNSYKISNGEDIRYFKSQSTNGVFSVYTIEINKANPNIASFIKKREFQSKLFSNDELDKVDSHIK
jgi:hypothetical protein